MLHFIVVTDAIILSLLLLITGLGQLFVVETWLPIIMASGHDKTTGWMMWARLLAVGAVAIVGTIWVLKSTTLISELAFLLFFLVNVWLFFLSFVTKHKILALVAASLVIAIGYELQSQFLLNIIQIVSLYWLWPYIFNKYPVIHRFYPYVLGGLMVVDIINIFVLQTHSGYVLDRPYFSFFITHGDILIGIGDVIVLLGAVTYFERLRTVAATTAAACFAVFATLPLVILKIVFETYAVPYLLFMVPVFL